MRGAGPALALWLLVVLLAGCAGPRVVPVPGAGVVVDPAQRSATLEGEGVQVVVRPSAWRGRPSFLPDYVTPVHLLVVNGSAVPLRYDHADLRLFDEARFQYTALPPVEVTRILRAAGAAAAPAAEVVLAGATPGALPWWRGPYYWDQWWPGWSPYYPYYWPPPRYDDVLGQALPIGVLDAGARTQGFVYFPRLRTDAHALSFEFHHRLGDAPRVLTLPLAVERAQAPPLRPAA